MPLVWNTEKVRHFSENPDDLWVTYGKGTHEEYQDVNPETKSLIFGTMSVGINTISFKTAADFFARWKILEKYVNQYVYYNYIDGKYDYVYLSPSILIKHFGLTTNASTSKYTDWLERICSQFKSEKIEVNLQTLKKEYKSFKSEFENSPF